MKKTLKLLLLGCCLALCLTALCLTALAAPAAPCSGKTGEQAACRSHSNSLVTLDDIPANRPLSHGKAYVPTLGHIEKNIPMVAVVVGFSNIGYSAEYDWNETFFSGERSVTAYYSDMSFGKFTFLPADETSAYDGAANTNRADRVNDGVIHITLPTRHEDWATDYSQTNKNKDKEQYRQLTEVFKAAVEAAAEYIDFASFDADGDGVIAHSELAVAFVIAGYEGAYLEDYSEVGAEKVLWAHAYTITDLIADYGFDVIPPAPGGVTVSDYIAMAEELEPGMPQPISTLAHELGHYIGLPDLYDTTPDVKDQWTGYDIYTSSIMSTAWGDDPETGSYTPFSMDPWCRCKLGWVDPVVADTNGDYHVLSQSYTEPDAYTVLLIPTQKEKEYYLVENRQLTKWDAGLAVSYEQASRIGGLIFWHIDDAVFEQYVDYNMVNNGFHRPAVMPLFPEEYRGSTVFTGAGTVYVGNPFYDRTFAIEKLSLPDAVIDLPVYGTGGLEDNRMGRWSSGVKVTLLNDSADDMQVRVNTDGKKSLKNGENECMYCHRVHEGFFGGIVAYFHRLMYVLRALFRR